MKFVQRDLAWMAVATVAAMAAKKLVNRGVDRGWAYATDEDPPSSKEMAVQPWRKALAFTLLSTVPIAIAELVSQKAAAAGWERVVGEQPPV